MTYIIAEQHVGNLTVHVTHDEEPQNPLDDNSAVHVVLGGPLKHLTSQTIKDRLGLKLEQAHGWHAIHKLLNRTFPGSVIQTVKFYAHGRTVLSTKSFQGRVPGGHYEFDCGLAGLVISTPAQMREWFGVKRVTAKHREEFIGVQSAVIDALTGYINGEVYQYEVLREDAVRTDDGAGGVFWETDYECLDACGGFYDLRQALDAGIEVAERLNEEAAANVPA